MAGTPVAALAEEENTGIKLLMPNMAEFIPACVAFIIIFVILSKFAWPTILKMMEDREAKIQGDLDAAEQAKTQAQTDAKAYEERLAEAEREAAEIVAAAKREAEEERARILAKAQKDAAATIAKARDAVESERKKALVQLSGSVVDLSVEIASKIVGDDLTDDQHRKLAERYLAEVGSTNGND
ncbi:F0F1 ATP synthase subunit B [uncultured Ruminococcus sp.]|uniref:F0F1 ATP synthase subunit B n=1 Tax=uncultured Ruminococcus sp. TaxID=165186 RepID=UPI0025FFDD82|nr:F0F1 ATP synthase subunit B [uncultured Ruminococcus sp.]